MSARQTWQGQAVIITGGASGIGRALGEAIAARGGHVVLADRQADLAAEVAEGIRGRGHQAEAAPLDVVDAAAFQSLVERVARERGRLDALFNNAGLGVFGEARHFELEHWNRTIDVNLRGVVHGVHAAYPLMARQGFGRIVNTASASGLLPFPMLVAYAMTKHAVVGLTLSLRFEAHRHGVEATALCPGTIRTPILEGGGRFGGNVSAADQATLEHWWTGVKRPIELPEFVRYALPRIERGDALVVMPWLVRWLWRAYRLAPGLASRIIEGDFADMVRRFPQLVERRGTAAPTPAPSQPADAQPLAKAPSA